MKSFWNVPAIVNPTRWVKKAQCHASNLYDDTAYSKADLTSNPFARALEITNNENSLMRFPRAELIRMTAELNNSKPGEVPKSKAFRLLPIINEELSLNDFYFAPSYILNNKSFIDSVIARKKLAKRYMPRKITYKLTGKYDSEFVPGFSDHIQNSYVHNIEALLCARDSNQDPKKPSMILTNQGPGLTIQGNDTMINLAALAPSISLKENASITLNYGSNKSFCDQILCIEQYGHDFSSRGGIAKQKDSSNGE